VICKFQRPMPRFFVVKINSIKIYGMWSHFNAI
jgi:hypothetical protein